MRTGLPAVTAAIVLAAAAGSLPARVVAAEATDAAALEGAETPLSAITVTAERRQTKLQETPIAITALTSEALEAQRIVSFADVALHVPNLTYTQFSTQESYFSIRGTLINNNAAGYDEAVSTFIDDVPVTGLGDNNPDLFDLSSIEVLRGPQGTLFGRNVTGGAVVIHTQPPSFTFGGKAEVTYGSDNLVEVRGLITGPVVRDTLAAKFAVDFNHRDDFVNNITLGGHTGGTNAADFRTQWLWRASPDVDVLFGADYLYDRSGGYATKLLGNFVPNLFPTLSYDPNTTNQGYNGFQNRDIAGLLLRVDWRTRLGTVTSISGFRYVNDFFPNDLLGDPPDQIFSLGIVQDHQYTEEIRLTSPSDGRLTYVVGGFFLHSTKREANPLNFNFSPNGLLGGLSYIENMDQHVTSDDYAVFGEGNYKILNTLKLTLGARETYERKAGFSVIAYIPNIGLPPGSATYSHGWSSFTPKGVLSWQPSHEWLLYGSISRGFKSGGYDLSGQSGSTPAQVVQLLGTPFQPETVWSYEVGEKFTGFGDRLAFDVDLFRADYKNLQTNQIVNVNNTFLSFTTNAAGARTQGVEVEASAQPVDWLSLGLTYAYMDAKFTNFPGVNGAKPNTGNTIPYSPRNQVHVSAEFHWPVTGLGGGHVGIGGDFTYHSQIFFTNANDTPLFIRQHTPWKGIVNLHANYETADGHWKLSVWAKNVTNERALLHGADVTSTLVDNADFTPSQTPGGNAFIFLAKYYPERTIGVTIARGF
ncbi:MAG TPA: TonB-dependent receptor [Caulobacteraceae bacterium]|nr:TonB-dependent receptor [Caulobacteraceae bacterium]